MTLKTFTIILALFIFSFITVATVVSIAASAESQRARIEENNERASREAESFTLWLIETNILKLSRVDDDSYGQLKGELHKRFKEILDEATNEQTAKSRP